MYEIKIRNAVKRAAGIAVSLSIVCSLLPVQAVTDDENETQARQYEAGDNVEAVDGTTGAPLGGFGAGAVKFNAISGSFADTIFPPADWRDYTQAGKSRFQLYSSVNGKTDTVDTMTAVCNDGRYDDDAIWPLHMVNFGEHNGIQVDMEAFSPFDNETYDNMAMPYAFYEMTLTNNNNSAADASIALLWDVSSGKGSSSSLKNVDGKGFTSDKWAVYAKADGAEITSGSDNGFMSTGMCDNNPSKNETRTAVKVKLNANETRTVKFVLAWYNYTDTTNNKEDKENSYYLGICNNVGEVAQRGLDNFDRLQSNAEGLVSRMRGSDVPAWYVNQCLNSLANISNNTMYKRDGRVAFSEGMWTCFGTMDQMWHARPIMNALIPELTWKELEYWAKTQRDDGQIHHDFNYMTDTAVKSKLVEWNDHEKEDYRDISAWVDLNCGFIISVYELYQQTADDTKLKQFWPNMKRAGQRILDQVNTYGDEQYPYTFTKSSNSYDAGGDANPFNASISAVAYKVMTIMCDKMSDDSEAAALKEKYQEAYDTVVDSYRKKYLDSNFPTGRVCEGFFAGQWLAMHMKLGEIWTQAETDKVLAALDDYYHPYYKLLGFQEGTYEEWTPYILNHYGGLLLHTQRQNQYEALQKDAYNRQFKNRNKVFNQQLGINPTVTVANYAATDISGKQQYISTPSIWRNYFDVIGYHRDASTKELWLEPLLLPEINHKMTNAAYISPEGYGTISCTETADEGSEVYQNKTITFKPERNTEVKKLYLADNFGENTGSISVKIDNKDYPFERIGTGYAKELEIEYNQTVTPEGITIAVSGDPGQEPPGLPEKPDDIDEPPVTAEFSAYSKIEAEKPSSIGHATSAAEDEIGYLTNLTDQEYAEYDYIGFEDGAGAISLTVRSQTESQIELKLGSVGGDTIQTLEIPNTHGAWQTVKYDLAEVIKGTNNIVFTFRSKTTGESSNLVDIDSFTFEYKYRLSSAKWTAAASKNENDVKNAFDGDLSNRWTSGPQAGEEWFLLDLGEECEFNRIVLNNPNNKGDYPRRYEILVSSDNKSFTRVAYGRGEESSTTITFERQKARYIKINQLEAADKYWSINEITIFDDVEDYSSGIQDLPPLPGPDLTITEYTYVGTESSHPDGTKYFDLTKYCQNANNAPRTGSGSEYNKFNPSVSDKVKREFGMSNDASYVANTYTSHMINYIGKSGNYDNKPAITGVTLPAGEYSLYYIGSNVSSTDRPIEVSFVNDTDNSVAVSDMNRYQLTDDTHKLSMSEWTVTVTKDYTGDITFANNSGWLPDLYAIKIVPPPPAKPADDATWHTYSYDSITGNEIHIICGNVTGDAFVKLNDGEVMCVPLVNGMGTISLDSDMAITSVSVANIGSVYPGFEITEAGTLKYDDLKSFSVKRSLPSVTCSEDNKTFTSSDNGKEITGLNNKWFDADIASNDLGAMQRLYWNKYKDETGTDHGKHNGMTEDCSDCSLIITAELKESAEISEVKLFVDQQAPNEPPKVTVTSGMIP